MPKTPEQIWAAADLPARRLAGVALNPSAPDDILLRLLADGPAAVRMVLCRDRILPDAVVDAVIEHPDKYTRSFFARNPHVDPAQRVRLLHDPDWFVRAHLAEGPRLPFHARPRPLPDEAIVHMITSYEGEHLGGLGFYRQMSIGLLRSMPTHPVAEVRRWGVGNWRQLPADTRAALLADPDDEVRKRAQRFLQEEDPAWVESVLPTRSCHGRTDVLLHQALSRSVVNSVLTAPAGPEDRAMIAANPSLPADVVTLLAADPDPEVRGTIARRADLGPAELRALVADPDPDVRRRVACHADLAPAELRALGTDPDPKVRLAVSVHPALSEDERARIAYEAPLDQDFVHHIALWTSDDPETVRRHACSGHPLLRRRAAIDRELPMDLMERLSADDDLGVRVLLAQNHPAAPAPLLLRSFLEYTGRERQHLTTRPNFPTAGLAAFADHEDPEVRALTARDPATSPATADRLTHDPDPAVRAALARHPNLPQHRLTELLDDPELAHAAAANPALDAAMMRALVTTAGRTARPSTV
ncbi:hypothetical protein ACFWFF_25305 [Streptomyces sp. NPDC060223]|uniref:hypothetical protein n=1 Tax=unclassified Streptomyces TaxID=2593676 RepID=UPI003627ECE3